MEYNNDLTAEFVKECLNYDPDIGIFTWKIRPREHFVSDRSCSAWNTKYANKEAGAINVPKGRRIGYKVISLNNKMYRAHRLAWLIVYGKWPKNQIDHIDRDHFNNKIDNLRDVPDSVNMKNLAMRIDNTSGYNGLSLSPNGIWRATIKVDGKSIHLGTFKNKEDAIQSRKNAEIKYGFHPNHGNKEIYG
jgi:hypothetical protein